MTTDRRGAGRTVSPPVPHPVWCERDVASELEGVEHVSGSHEWRPTYEHEVAIVDLLRQVVYLDGDAETPAATMCVENPSRPGEVALTADDLAALVDRLLRLRDALIADQ